MEIHAFAAVNSANPNGWPLTYMARLLAGISGPSQLGRSVSHWMEELPPQTVTPSRFLDQMAFSTFID
jgi:hypothetical protein